MTSDTTSRALSIASTHVHRFVLHCGAHLGTYYAACRYKTCSGLDMTRTFTVVSLLFLRWIPGGLSVQHISSARTLATTRVSRLFTHFDTTQSLQVYVGGHRSLFYCRCGAEGSCSNNRTHTRLVGITMGESRAHVWVVLARC